jgi:NAD(P)-dependent dehydrogenase (short-subunit alcohol dehydrogenase family)
MRLKDKVAIVTGGTGGIGRGIVERFAQEGARVTFTGRRVELGEQIAAGLRQDGAAADYLEMDARRLDDVRRVIQQTASRHGRLDVIVNNVGTAVPGTILNTTEDDFDLMFETNVRSLFFATKWVAEIMVDQRFGSIVNIGSTGATEGLPKRAAYTGTKGAVLQISRSAALDLARYNVRVNCLSPGAIDTPMLRRARWGDQPGQDELVQALGEKIPLGRTGQPRDIAWAAVYLASDESEWVSGANFVVAGGAFPHS